MMVSQACLDYFVPERGDDLYRALMQCYWLFTLSDRIVSSVAAARITDEILDGKCAIRHLSEQRMIEVLFTFREMYGDVHG